MKTYGGVEVWPYTCLTPALGRGEWSASRPTRFDPKKRALGTHWIGNWVEPRTGLDAVAKREIPASAGDRTPVFHCTDWATSAPQVNRAILIPISWLHLPVVVVVVVVVDCDPWLVTMNAVLYSNSRTCSVSRILVANETQEIRSTARVITFGYPHSVRQDPCTRSTLADKHSGIWCTKYKVTAKTVGCHSSNATALELTLLWVCCLLSL
jgi:hypothetical protein